MTSQSASAMLHAPVSSARRDGVASWRIGRHVHRVEELVAAAALTAMVFLLLVEIAFRPWYGFVIPGSQVLVRQLTMWVALLGAARAARDGRLLAIGTGALVNERTRERFQIAGGAIAAAVTGVLCVAAVGVVLDERELGTRLAVGLHAWTSELILPFGFLLIAVRLVLRATAGAKGRAVLAAAVVCGAIVALRPSLVENSPAWLWVGLLAGAGVMGAPLFAVLGGLAVFLFMADGVPPLTVVGSAYELTTNPILPALPMFTLGGFLLAEGDTPERLLRVFRGLFGWIPGGTAIACVIVSAFFTIFTGGSGVTILALGGLLLPTLLKDGYRDRFSVGLLTGSGSLGLLLPPALPLILYAIVAEVSIKEMMVGGVLPGILLIVLAAFYGVRAGTTAGVPRERFTIAEAAAAVWHGKWEVLLPVLVLGAFFRGYATIVETAAITAIYAFVVQVLIHRNVPLRRVGPVFAECVTTIGGVLIILAAAKGLGSYMVDAQIPATLIAWTREYVDNRYVFLLGLNVFLLIVGCLIDIFSATFVVVPLIAPLGAEFGINPVHLGMIFIANLELGYLTPPVGLNLFLSSYRFNRPLLQVCRASLPMLIILGVGVLLITYVPWLTTALLPLFAFE